MMEEKDKSVIKVSLRDVLFVIFSKWHVFIGILLAVVILTNLISVVVRPIYEVSGSVLVKPTIDHSLLYRVPPESLIANPLSPQDINSEIGIMQSEELLRQVVEELELYAPQEMEEPFVWFSKIFAEIQERASRWGLLAKEEPIDAAVKKLRDTVKIKPITMSNMAEVNLRGNDPAKITNIVNTLLDRYIDKHIKVHQPEGGEAFFSNQAGTYLTKLRDSERGLKEFQKKWSLMNIEAQRNGNLTTLSILRQNLSLLNAKIAEQQTKLAQSIANPEAMTKDLVDNQALTEMTKSILPLVVERERITTLYPKNSIEYQDLNSQMQEIHQRSKELVTRVLEGGKIDVNALVSQRGELEKAIRKIEEETIALTEKEVELNRLIRDLKQNEKIFLLYSDKSEEARIEKQKGILRVSNVSVVSWAEEPSVPIFPKKLLMGILSILMGLIVGLAGAFMAYYLDHSVKQPADLPRRADVPVLSAVTFVDKTRKGTVSLPGKLRALKGDSYHDLWMNDPLTYPDIMDSLRIVKNRMARLQREENGKIFLVTGPDRKVGTSTLTFNLGLIIARDMLDQRILLVDASLSNPELHTVFSVPQEPGLMDYLLKNLAIDQITRESPLPNMQLVPVGRIVDEVTSPFDLKRFTNFLDEVRQQYDWILLDSAPVLRSSHSRVLSPKMDGVITVAETNVTRWEVLVELREQLIKDGAKLVGGILNKRRFVIPKWVYRSI